MGKGTTTRSPVLRFFTPRPTSTTSPMNSWPRMSPFRIDGTFPPYRCRSEPQMAVEVTRTTASRGERSSGSGTLSTRMSSLPNQQTAFIPRLLHPGTTSPLPRARLTFRRRDLAGLDGLLEAAEVLAHLHVRLLAEHLRDQRAEPAGRRLVLEHDLQLGAAAAGRRPEVDRSGVRHGGVVDRLPRQQLAGDLVDDLRLPLHRLAGGGPGPPARAPLVEDRHRLQVVHDRRQVLEVAPEAVQVGRRVVAR